MMCVFIDGTHLSNDNGAKALPVYLSLGNVHATASRLVTRHLHNNDAFKLHDSGNGVPEYFLVLSHSLVRVIQSMKLKKIGLSSGKTRLYKMH